MLIKLKKEEPKPNSIYIPLTHLDQTDGGKIISKPHDNQFLLKGVIVDASPKALINLNEEGIEISDEVLLTQAASQPGYIFYPDRDILNPKHEGYVLVPSQFIEAKVLPTTNEF